MAISYTFKKSREKNHRQLLMLQPKLKTKSKKLPSSQSEMKMPLKENAATFNCWQNPAKSTVYPSAAASDLIRYYLPGKKHLRGITQVAKSIKLLPALENLMPYTIPASLSPTMVKYFCETR